MCLMKTLFPAGITGSSVFSSSTLGAAHGPRLALPAIFLTILGPTRLLTLASVAVLFTLWRLKKRAHCRRRRLARRGRSRRHPALPLPPLAARL